MKQLGDGFLDFVFNMNIHVLSEFFRSLVSLLHRHNGTLDICGSARFFNPVEKFLNTTLSSPALHIYSIIIIIM